MGKSGQIGILWVGQKQSLGKNANLSETDQHFLYHCIQLPLSSGGTFNLEKKTPQGEELHFTQFFYSLFHDCTLNPEDSFDCFQLATSSLAQGLDTLSSASCASGPGAHPEPEHTPWRTDVTCSRLWVGVAGITVEDEQRQMLNIERIYQR